MARYSIDGQILTDIADSLRVKAGRTGLVEAEPVIGVSENVLSDNTGPYIETPHETTRWVTQVITAPGAKNIRIQYAALTGGSSYSMNAYIVPGNYPDMTYSGLPSNRIIATKISNWYCGWNEFTEKTFENVDSVTFVMQLDSGVQSGIYVKAYGQCTDVIKPEEMATTITGLPPAPNKEKLTFSGDLSYAFYKGIMDWVVNDYGEDVTFEDVTNLYFTFQNSAAYPVNGIHCGITTASKTNNGSHSFNGYEGTQLPMVYNFIPSQMDSMFAGMDYVREFPEGFGDDWDFSYIEGLTNQYSGLSSDMFSNCVSLRKVPMNLLHGNPAVNYSYATYRGMCNQCYVLDELIDIPNVHWNGIYNSTSTSSNLFKDMVKECCRLKDFTFASNFEVNGLPVKWANQVLDLTTVGYKSVPDYQYFTYSQYSGCTQDKVINSDETYALLKDDPDATVSDARWSRYDKASALRTIASLPDCSAYQTQNNQGANIIKFKGTSGSLTDNGSIFELTEEEIAVAAAKGWTVTLV